MSEVWSLTLIMHNGIYLRSYIHCGIYISLQVNLCALVCSFSLLIGTFSGNRAGIRIRLHNIYAPTYLHIYSQMLHYNQMQSSMTQDVVMVVCLQLTPLSSLVSFMELSFYE